MSPDGSGVTEKEFEDSFKWLNRHFSFLYHADGSLTGLDDILERLKVAVMRHGIRGAVIDPYNFISRNRDISETDWVSELLTTLKAFCMAHGVHIWFVAHPQKMRKYDNGELPVPEGNDISGSAAWFAKADFGVTLHRDRSGLATFHVWKVRYSWTGKLGSTALAYNTETSTYEGEPDPTRVTATMDDWRSEL